jgi:hypothetical protein
MKYELENKCHGCDELKRTRSVKRLDPQRSDIINYICKGCDKSHSTIPKILDWNRKNLPETTSIFGFPLKNSKYISGIDLKIYIPKDTN